MKEIRMVDLHGQYLHLKEEIDTAIREVIDTTAFIKGPQVTAFEEALASYTGSRSCVTCGNGTDALQVAMMALGLAPGDEVITTPFTFIATIEVIELLRLKPVLVDIDPETFAIDASLIEEKITPKTRAIVPVHLFGQAVDMNSILEIAAKHELHVIEDNAQALGATYRLTDGTIKKTGTMGVIGCTSFFPSKNLGAYGDGGALFTDDDNFAVRLRSTVNHGMSEKYHYDHVGVNSRLDTIQAAILRAKLAHLDQYNQARQKAASFYDAELGSLPGVKIPARNPSSTHIFHQYTLQVDPSERDRLKSFLLERRIPSMIYYPDPLHLQKAYEHLGYRENDLPVSEEMCHRVLSLPMHTELDEEQLNYITTAVRDYF